MDWRKEFDSFDSHDTSEIEGLITEWKKEKFALELLKPNFDISKVFEFLENRESEIEEKRLTKEKTINLIYEMELQRLKFILTSYQKIRLYKIEQLASFIRSSPEEMEKLSPPEKSFLKKYKKLETKSYMSVLGKDATLDEEEMKRTPAVDQFVLCRILKNKKIEKDSVTIDFVKNKIYVVRYEDIVKFLKNGEAELL